MTSFLSLGIWTDVLISAQIQKDVLASTLASGVQVKHFVPSYGNLSNEITQVTKCQANIP